MHRLRLAAAAAAAALAATALAHGDHASQAPLVAADADWMTRHMAEEHHMNAWDAASFFALHDYNGDGLWHVDEMQRTYGLMDESNSGLAQPRRDDVARQLLALLDADADGAVTRAEWDAFIHAGKTLPDLGTGPGHHNDAEYEYEIHHWDNGAGG
ncbi:hypothetical protein BN1708_001467 [Verticillium longisporum]|uniref:EF-hand domain-containing protein n=1 Tax=Verticillium longisporum TaxID=100787 RepID=A0A0G4MTY1_VERLO|nr:hypothetical protein BN1708_001467 [Verticillium longisporum]